MEINGHMLRDNEKVKSTEVGSGFVACLPWNVCFMSSEGSAILDI